MARNAKQLKWYRDQVAAYARALPLYERCAEVLRQVLERGVRQCAPEAIVQARAKTLAGFAEKTLRKQAKCNDPVNQFTDLCGARVITHTRAEATAVAQFVESHFDPDPDNSVDASQRLRPTEFGYRSVHYVVTFKRGVFPTRDVNVRIPQALYPDSSTGVGPKAEIQVRTVLEHGWADTSHELAYKSAFPVPPRWERELASLAAMLENADADFARIRSGLRVYTASYGSYLSDDQMREKIKELEIVLRYDRRNAEVASQIGKLAITLGDWQKAIEVLSRHVPSGHPSVLRDLGVAICKLHRAHPRSSWYRSGQRHLMAAIARCPEDTDAIASLAGTWKGVDDGKARELYRQAYEVDPSDPYPLSNHLEQEIIHRRDTAVASCMAPVLRAAIRRCRDQADVGTNMPWAFYSMGQLHLFLGEAYESLAAYAKAVQVSNRDWMAETSLRSVDALAVVQEQIPGYEWVRRLLLLALATRFRHPGALRHVKRLATAGARGQPIAAPVTLVAGDGDAGRQSPRFRRLLREAFRDWTGTVISGGTTAGVSGLVGALQRAYPALRTIGYVPKRTPGKAAVDVRYSEIRRVEGQEFSVLQPLQAWTDLVARGVDPAQVRLLGIGGRAIAAAEYRVALALGALLGVVQGSGGEAMSLLRDDYWNTSPRLVQLPEDAMTVRAFIGPGATALSRATRETIAKGIHESYRRAQATRKPAQDPAMAEWDRLAENLKESNRKQADHFFTLLRQVGCTVRKVQGRYVALMKFSRAEVETMAEMEHARWNVERLLDGWKWGPERDVAKKISPYLVGWAQLPDNVKEWDRETVRRIPALLASVGVEVRR